MKRLVLVLLASLSLVAAACGANGEDTAGEDDGGEETTETTVAEGELTGTFGDMDSPCGPDIDGTKVTVNAAEAGLGPDKLRIGIANDATAEARPGLLKEMLDATTAFVNWCNEQGGIGGLELEAVNLDGQLFKIEAAMTKACSEVFAMVGGGYAQDNQVFTGKDGSDFHKCKMIAFPGFAVSADFGEANGVIQPIPNVAYYRSVTWMEDLAKLHPDKVGKVASVYGEGLPSIRINKDQNKATAAGVEGFGFTDDVSYALMNQDFSVTAQKVIDLGATAVMFVGEPENYSSLMAELTTKGWDGIAFADANEYDQRLFTKGPAEGAYVRIAIHMFEERDQWPAIDQFLDIMDEYGPDDAVVAALGIQSFSAGLLFATAVGECAKANGGEINRACVIEAGKGITEWDGGGMHAVVDPSLTTIATGPSCSTLVKAEGGKFVRAYPESSDEGTDGFSCIDGGNVKVEGDFGKGNVDPSLPY